MRKRKTKAVTPTALSGLVLILSAVGALLQSVSPYLILFVVLAAIGLIAFLLWANENELYQQQPVDQYDNTERERALRRQQLMDKYSDTEIVELILNKKVWVGATSDHVLDAWGNPTAVDRKILRTKVKEVWKYNQQGRNRFSNRVILHDGIVIGHVSKNIRVGSA